MQTNTVRSGSSSSISFQRKASHWAKIPLAPPDSIIGLINTFYKDTNKDKVDLTMGTYRDEEGKPHVLSSVSKASENILKQNVSKEYLPIQGFEKYLRLSENFIFGENNAFVKDKLISVQCIAGSGAISIASAFLARFWPGKKTIYVSKPTWPPHISIPCNSGLTVKEYRYTDPKTIKLDFNGMLQDIKAMPDQSIIMLQACAHNPTGVDLTEKHWKELADVIKCKEILPFFDLAFQGFATGDLDTDAFAPRYFIEQGINLCVATSFSKNMGLYAERIGTLTFTTDGKEESERIMSQLKIMIRPLYNSPPINGARIVVEILSNRELYSLWLEDLAVMLKRLKDMRRALFDALKRQGSKRNWDSVLSQIGPYFYMNMSDDKVDQLRNEFHIYIRHEGRLSLAGLNRNNIDYVAKGLHKVTEL